MLTGRGKISSNLRPLKLERRRARKIPALLFSEPPPGRPLKLPGDRKNYDPGGVTDFFRRHLTTSIAGAEAIGQGVGDVQDVTFPVQAAISPERSLPQFHVDH
jgi:hypothetical protein